MQKKIEQTLLRYEVVRVDTKKLPKDLGGQTTCVKGRPYLIEISDALKEPEVSYVYLHEVLHGCLPDYSEDSIAEITDTLWANFTIKKHIQF